MKTGRLADIDASILRVVKGRNSAGAEGQGDIMGHEAGDAVLPRSRAARFSMHIWQGVFVLQSRKRIFDGYVWPQFRIRTVGRGGERWDWHGVLRYKHEEAWPFLRVSVVTRIHDRASHLVSKSEQLLGDIFQIVHPFSLPYANDILKYSRGA